MLFLQKIVCLLSTGEAFKMVGTWDEISKVWSRAVELPKTAMSLLYLGKK